MCSENVLRLLRRDSTPYHERYNASSNPFNGMRRNYATVVDTSSRNNMLTPTRLAASTSPVQPRAATKRWELSGSTTAIVAKSKTVRWASIFPMQPQGFKCCLDSDLYLPECWAEDAARRKKRMSRKMSSFARSPRLRRPKLSMRCPAKFAFSLGHSTNSMDVTGSF